MYTYGHDSITYVQTRVQTKESNVVTVESYKIPRTHFEIFFKAEKFHVGLTLTTANNISPEHYLY